MPLQTGYSRETVSKNIAEMRHAGKKPDQAVAAAMDSARRAREGAMGHGRALKRRARSVRGQAMAFKEKASGLGDEIRRRARV